MLQKPKWLDRPIHPSLPAITIEILIFAFIILLAIATRFYDLGARVMSHDESLHTYFSWLLYRGQGYQHTPMMHGPWQFHWIALSYFLFGVSDYTARIPAALFGIAAIVMVWYWRRYLGRAGALIAGFMMVISPYLLFYGRYVREDMYAVFSSILMLYTVLRYLETRAHRYLFILAAALVIHFLDKETAYIQTIQLIVFLAIYFIAQVIRNKWRDHEGEYVAFILLLVAGLLLLVFAAGAVIQAREVPLASGVETVAPSNPDQTGISPLEPVQTSLNLILVAKILGALAVVVLIAAVVLLFIGFGWQRMIAERSFDLLMVTGTLIIPLGTPLVLLPFKDLLKVSIPTDGPSVQNMTISEIVIIAGFLTGMFVLSFVLGWIWKRDLWWKLALTFWVPYTVLYTTFFTNTDGFFTGTLGSLGYWMVQQEVERGSQPWYYYLLVQVPMYEFLPAIGFILALIIGLRRSSGPGPSEPSLEAAISEAPAEPVSALEILAAEADEPNHQTSDSQTELAAAVDVASRQANGFREYELGDPQGDPNFVNMFTLLIWWSVSSLIALSYAGERMPWLTVHITWPMILLTGWALGQLVHAIDWEALRKNKGLLTLAAAIVFIASLVNALLSWNLNPPFQGMELAQLQATSAFLLPAIVALGSAFALAFLLRNWTVTQVLRLVVLTFFGFLMIATARAAFRAAYINYDHATEFLVYAHSSTAVKQVIAQAKEISERTTGGMNVALAYDNSAPDTGVSWPFVWYLRDFTNQRTFDTPTRSLRESVLVIVDAKNFDKIEPALGPNFYRIDYIRMWWPMQDYFAWTSTRDPSIPFDEFYPCRGVLGVLRLFKSTDYSRVCNGITNPEIRAGIIDIWWNRDYTRYAQATNHSDLALASWQPSDQMRLYIRKDVAAQIWNYGVSPAASETTEDPTEGKLVELAADRVIDGTQMNPPGLNYPHGLAFARNGSFFVADSLNHRILHFDAEGNLLKAWGSFGQSTDAASAPRGTFNEPWGVAVGPDGAVYVTDTWNHRVQKFTADGVALLEWGHSGQAETLDAFYGPRGIAVDSHGHVFVADTGNKRIVVFDKEGNPITQIGSAGFDAGQFDEPVGLAVDSSGRLYVADTWNQRIQTFLPSADGLSFTPEKQWDIPGWIGQSLDNKPFIAVDGLGRVFITDPEGYRVMEFSNTGELLRVWGDYGTSSSTFGLPAGIAVDPEGYVWVTDSRTNRILRFLVP